MFAIVEIQGKQYRVKVGDVIEVALMTGAVGDTVSFDRVLLTNEDKKTVIGTPVVSGATVKAKVLEQKKGEKIDIRRFKHKVRYRKQRGFRSLLSKIEIVSIG